MLTQTHPNLIFTPTPSPNLETLAIIPAYNEDRFIASVVIKTRAFVNAVLVVDDGSTDETASVAEAAGARVLRLARNQGKSAAVNAGLAEARLLNAAYVVLLDGDGQHHPADIPNLLAPLHAGEADIVVGSRFLERHSAIPGWRILGQHSLTAATNLLSGVSVTDSQSGFRALSRCAIEKLDFHQRGFAIESEMQFQAHELHLRIAEAPIGVTYAEGPKRNPVTHGLRVLNGILQLVGQARPLLFFSVPGLILSLAGIGMGTLVVNIYEHTQMLAVGYALITVLLTTLGTLSMFTGLMLHSIRGLLLQFAETKTRP